MYKNNPYYEVVCFTAAQIPGIDDRKFPAKLAGKLYPKGIPILPEEKLTKLIQKHRIDEVVFAYSDVPHEYVMHKASECLAAGTNFRLLGPHSTMLQSTKSFDFFLNPCARHKWQSRKKPEKRAW